MLINKYCVILPRFVNSTLQRKMQDVMKHTGMVEAINGNNIQVRIIQSSACSACSIKEHCTSSETKEKVIDAVVMHPEEYRVGEQVWVNGAIATGRWAVTLAFVIPVLLLIASLFIFTTLTGSELYGIFSSLAIQAVYYGILSLFKDKMKKQFSFWIEKTEI